MWKCLVFALIVGFFICAGGCARDKPRMPIVPETPETNPGPVVPDSGLGVEFDVQAAGNILMIRIGNNTPDTIRVSPFYFALIVDNRRPEIRYNPAIAGSRFPLATLKTGEIANGVIQFNDYKDLVGQKLVFNSPDHKPIVAVIRETGP